MRQHARLRLIVIYVSAAVLMIGTVGPFLWLVSSSFQYERQLLSRPPQWLPNPVVLDSYREIFEGAVLGEESGDTHSASPYVWIIDPIDGTKNYIRHIPLFATQIALMRENELILGVSNAPAMTELLHAEKDRGAFLNNQRVNVTDVGLFDEAMICHGGLKYFSEKGILTNLFTLANDTHRTRGFGDCYMYHLLASGRADAVIEAAISIWDIAALTVIVEEAGGRVTNLRGESIDRNTDSILATNGFLHQQILTRFEKTLNDAV